MIETLEQFRARTNYIWNRLSEGGFDTAPGCAAKVSRAGRLLPFYGDTTIFDLASDDIAWLTGLQNALYEACGEFLSDRLRPETFHITLHDLFNGTDWQVIEAGVQKTLTHARQVVDDIRKSFPWGVHVRAKCLVNMVNTSVVLTFEPVDEANCQPLMEMHARLQAVVPLSYPLTPHVTLAYFRPGKISAEAGARLQAVFDAAGVDGNVLHLDVSRLNACTFTDMNHYHVERENAFDLERFVCAQADCYTAALSEIRTGRKCGHWMWYVFPQMKGLGRSFEANYYGIASLEEARAYLAHPVLGPRLAQITHSLEGLDESSPTAVMGYPDDIKLRSCMTLFEAAGGGSVFSAVLNKFYHGERDAATLELLKAE